MADNKFGYGLRWLPADYNLCQEKMIFLFLQDFTSQLSILPRPQDNNILGIENTQVLDITVQQRCSHTESTYYLVIVIFVLAIAFIKKQIETGV